MQSNHSPLKPSDDDNVVDSQDKEKREIREEKSREETTPHSCVGNQSVFNHTIPYTQCFQKQKLDKQFSKFLDVFKKCYINISFTNALEQMSSYVKFMKDILSKKRL